MGEVAEVLRDYPDAGVGEADIALALREALEDHHPAVAELSADAAAFLDEHGGVPGVEWVVSSALQRVPSRQRAVLVLQFFEGLTSAEIAESLGMTPASVRILSMRGLRAVRNALAHVADTPAATSGRPEVLAAISSSAGLTTTEAALAMGVDASRVRHRLRDGSLFAVRKGSGKAILPTWQFDSQHQPLPHLAAILTDLPKALHPLEVARFFSTPQDVLEINGNPVSARDWLSEGGDPEPVKLLARSLDEAV